MLGSTTGRLTLLRRRPSFRLLVLASVGSGFGTYLAAIALSVDIYDRTGSGKWLAALLIADFLPIVLIGLTLGPLVDRLSRRRLMIVADLVRAGVFCALPFVDSPAAIVALAGASGVATGFFRPAVYAGLPNLVDDDELAEANSLLAGIENVAWMVGPIVGGALLAASGPSLAYWINAVTFLVSALAAGTPWTWSIFNGGETFASKIANNAAEFSNPSKTGAYIAAGLVLFVLTFVVNSIARIVIERRKAFTE